MAENFLTVEQAATRLHVHPITVRRHLRLGMLRGIKRGNLWRVPESALMENATNSSPAAPEKSPLALALAMVEARDARVGKTVMRQAGINDAATELRQIREARTP